MVIRMFKLEIMLSFIFPYSKSKPSKFTETGKLQEINILRLYGNHTSSTYCDKNSMHNLVVHVSTMDGK